MSGESSNRSSHLRAIRFPSDARAFRVGSPIIDAKCSARESNSARDAYQASQSDQPVALRTPEQVSILPVAL